MFKDGLRNGFGYYRFANGDCYEGMFMSGIKSGKGLLMSKDDKSSYEGLF